MKMKKTFLFIIFTVLLAVNLSAQDRDRPITLIGFGVPVDVPRSMGDTWASAQQIKVCVIHGNITFAS
jgi:hypothetical protein